MSDKATRKINVLRTSQIASGTGKNNQPWTLYEVIAVTPEGAAIEQNLKSFDQLPDGEVEVEIERQDDPKYGTSFMLRKAGGGGGGGSSGARLGPKVDELRDRVDRLEPIVTRLVDEVNALRQLAHENARQPAARLAGAAAPAEEPEDIPFAWEGTHEWHEVKGHDGRWWAA